MAFSPCVVALDFGGWGGFGNAFLHRFKSRAAFARAGQTLSAKRKGLQLALEPLDGRGIAGYVPKP